MNERKASPAVPTLVIVGAGPGIGLAAARRFGTQDYKIGLIARNSSRLEQLSSVLRHEGIFVEAEVADASAPDELTTALARLQVRRGAPGVVCFSPLPSLDLIKPVLETTAADLAASLSLNVGGAASTVRAVVPALVERGHGTLLFVTGSGALRPAPERAASAVTTSAETTYVQLLHRALAPAGVHAAQLTVVGAVGDGLAHEPATVADALWTCHTARDKALTVLG